MSSLTCAKLLPQGAADVASHACCQVRENIEATGRDARWEFSKAALFERTQHMAEACACLAGMVETVAGLYQFMGPQLKAVTGDPQALIPLTTVCLMLLTRD